MKKLEKILMLMLLVFSAFSCSKDEAEPAVTLKNETISAKWLVAGTESGYFSFEFNKSGTYIVQKIPTTTPDEKLVYFGDYNIINDKSINLADFGTLKIASITKDAFSFTISTPDNPSNNVLITTTKADEMPSTTKTDLLCRTWKMTKFNGEDVVGTEHELTVLFSKAGTYFVEIANPLDGDEGGLSNWKWKDSNEVIMCYSWEGTPNCDNVVEVLELTTSSLKIKEVSDWGTYLYELVPANGSGSMALPKGDTANQRARKSLFFR